MEWKKFDKYMPMTQEHADYIRKLADYCQSSKRRPQFHLVPPCGLMNDPNGLAYYNGNYHIFYQWYPFGPSHGMKHWGHFVSRDMISFSESEEILIPTEEYEKNGCYSGNGIQIGEKLFLYYTANYKTPDGRMPKQAVAFLTPDGRIRKYEKNPIIDEIPQGMTGDIRDPFVFYRNNRYYMLLGGRSKHDRGILLLYGSSDGLVWEYQGNLSLGNLECGTMIECPGLIRVGDKDVLFLSIIGLRPKGDRYCNEFTSLCLIGNLDIENLQFQLDSYDELDKGFDFYAPQPFYDKDGQPSYFAWFGCGVQKLPYMEEDMWVHGLTMPRKLMIQDGKLVQRLYGENVCQYETYRLKKGTMHPSADSFHLHMNQSETDICCIRLGLENDCVQIFIDREKGRMTVDRSSLKKNFCQEYGETRSLSFRLDKPLELDLFYDNTFAELFVNNGEEVMTFRAFLPFTEIYAE